MNDNRGEEIRKENVLFIIRQTILKISVVSSGIVLFNGFFIWSFFWLCIRLHELMKGWDVNDDDEVRYFVILFFIKQYLLQIIHPRVAYPFRPYIHLSADLISTSVAEQSSLGRAMERWLLDWADLMNERSAARWIDEWVFVFYICVCCCLHITHSSFPRTT